MINSKVSFVLMVSLVAALFLAGCGQPVYQQPPATVVYQQPPVVVVQQQPSAPAANQAATNVDPNKPNYGNGAGKATVGAPTNTTVTKPGTNGSISRGPGIAPATATSAPASSAKPNYTKSAPVVAAPAKPASTKPNYSKK